MRKHYIFVAGTCALGLTIGLLTALSNSPVVAILIPLLFGLIAGASGFYLSREDITAQRGRDRLAFTGACVLSICIGLISAVVATFWAQSAYDPEPFQELAGNERSLTLDEQMRATEVRAIARMLGADSREQIQIVRAAIHEARNPPQEPVAGQSIEAIQAALISSLEIVGGMKKAETPANGETDSFVEDFNTAVYFADALVLIHEQANGSSIEMRLWRDRVENLMQPVGALVGTETSLNVTNFLRLSEEMPTALIDLMRLRAVGVKWLEITAPKTSINMPHRELLPQSRTNLIKLLRGTPDIIATPTTGYFPSLAERRIIPLDMLAPGQT